jgi:hypothetical protein
VPFELTRSLSDPFVITLNGVDEPTASEVNPLLSTAVVPVLVPFKK